MDDYAADAADLAESRERVISEIYDTILDPSRYDALMSVWAGHLEVIEQSTGFDARGGLELTDPELQAHFDRVRAVLDRVGRQKTTNGGQHSVSASSDLSLRISFNATILERSQSACAMFGQNFSMQDFCSDLDEEDRKKLQDALTHASMAKPNTLLTVIRLSASGKILGVIARPNQTRPDRGGVIVRTLDMDWSDALGAMLAEVFQLSPKEVAVVEDIAHGHSLNDIAKRRNRSTHTVRAQTKSVLRKTGASSQSDIIRLVSTLSPFTEAPRDVVSGQGFKTATARPQRLPDNRIMAVHEIGPAAGRPAIFIHGMLDGTSLPDRAVKMLNDRNIRLICPIRPGFGEAGAPTVKVGALDQFAHDLSQLIAVMRIERPIVIGHMSGALYAYAAAHHLRNAIGGVVSVSGGVPIESLKQFREMAPRQRTVAFTARFAPALLPAILRAGISLIDNDNSNAFMNALYPKGHFDRKIAETCDLVPLLYDGYRFTVAQGSKGFEVDSHHVIRDWSDMVEGCTVPVICVHGIHDPVVKIDSVRRFCAGYDFAELRENADAGQLIFYQKPQTVLDAVEDLMRRL